MPAGRTRAGTRGKAKVKRTSHPSQSPPGDVLTLAETAAYLRVSEEAVLRAIAPEGLPGRLIDGEWRSLKSAVNEWLSTPSKPTGKGALLNMAGAFKGDPFLDRIVREAYRQREQSITEDSR